MLVAIAWIPRPPPLPKKIMILLIRSLKSDGFEHDSPREKLFDEDSPFKTRHEDSPFKTSQSSPSTIKGIPNKNLHILSSVDDLTKFKDGI